MKYKNMLVCALLCVASLWSQAQSNLEPKYGDKPKTAEQQAADDKLIAALTTQFQGDLKAPSLEASKRGWAYLLDNQLDMAMRRFNQAWLLAPNNGMAIWGMAVVEMRRSRAVSSLQLFREATQLMPRDLDLRVDAAAAKSVVAGETGDQDLLEDAWRDFRRVYEADPLNTLNLQAWAISYFDAKRYRDAWDIVALAEKTPGVGDLDVNFIRSLGGKMPRP